MSVFVAAHRKFNADLPQNYEPLQVGAALHDNLGFLSDNTGDSISEKNPNFCELTGLYWIWKNREDDYKGLVHYRRYFEKCGKKIDEAFIKNTLNNYDIILPNTEYLRESAWEELPKHSGREKDLINLKKVIGEIYPDYLPAFDTVMSGNTLHLYNMMIASRKVFDAYCEWLFDILLALEPITDMSDYTDYEKRVFGFLSERLLNVWVLHNDLKVKTLKVKNSEGSFKGNLRHFLRRYKNRLFFYLGR
ncbi:MAG: DUF4422 domain-containing protein [Clostridiales bacterium]|nr:DUF4422 domain-containing protein [Candidatus Equinaster intestinalis]